MKRLLLTLLCGICYALTASAQYPFRLSEGWISVPGIDGQAYGVYYFRKDVNLQAVPASVKVKVSGDNRYKFFVNGSVVSIGPARSDVAHWNYDVIDLAPYLKSGKNVLVAKVWNDGPQRPEANMTYRTGFMLQPAEDAAKAFASNDSWRCIQDPGYQPFSVRAMGYLATGPSEIVDMNKVVADWQDPEASLSGWQKAQVIGRFIPRGISEPYGTNPGWMLQPSILPQRELTLERLAEVREAKGIKVPKGFLQGKQAVTIPANTEAELILDQKHLTNAYLTLKFSQGAGATIMLGYTEAFYDNQMKKGNRNDLTGKHFFGRKDSLISNGRAGQQFTTMEWRTYRYLLLRVKTAAQPLTLNDVYGTFTGYPFQLRAALKTQDSELKSLFNIGWRTARLCAIETYMDCPYYEQLQYFGDARIQALVSLYMTADDHLVKVCHNMADWSRGADGVTQSRYPSNLTQWIQPYALHYIYSLHDYMMYGTDVDFLKGKLMGSRTILDYFHRYQQADGRVKNLPGWNFTDWVDKQENWRAGVALTGADGCNSVMDLQLLYAYEMAADLERQMGMPAFADLYAERISQLKASIQKTYWRAGRGLYSDRADKDVFSQHAQALAILTGMVQGNEAKKLAEAIEQDQSLAPASIYFKYYTHEAMAKAGLADHYLQWLDKWRENIKLGLTTWAETSDVDAARSDCHAWGASPNIELLRTVLGIDSDAPSFAKVRITPHLGTITEIGGEMPHPKGMIKVAYKVKGEKMKATVTLPDGVGGTFVWRGHQQSLHGGTQEVNL